MVCGLVRTACYPNIYRSASQARSYFNNFLAFERIKKLYFPFFLLRENIIVIFPGFVGLNSYSAGLK